MGTRNLTAVVCNGEYKLAQYGQWDGYPDGQGITALTFARDWLNNDERRAYFREQLGLVRFVDQEEHHKMWASVGAGDSDYVTGDISAAFHRKWPYFTRDHGAEILELVHKAKEEVLTKNSITFVSDSLFCEYAYVIDLDKCTLEVYRGFNKEPVPDGERFANVERETKPDGTPSDYYPIRLAGTFELNNLPSDAVFLESLKERDEEDDAA